MLTGKISPVQERALDLLDLLEAKERSEDYSRQVRMALVAADPSNLLKVFPEWFSQDEPEQVAADDDLTDTSGDWKFETSPDDAKDLLATLMANPSGTVTMQQVDEEGGWV